MVKLAAQARIRVNKLFILCCCGCVKMFQVLCVRVFVQQRLSAADEDIFELFGRTIAEYEEEVRRQRKLLDAVFKPSRSIRLLDVSHHSFMRLKGTKRMMDNQQPGT